MPEPKTKRCEWARSGLMVRYHDAEWGVPVHDDRMLFEQLVLQGFQAGLSWETILKKRANFREAFDNFDAVEVSAYTGNNVRSLLSNKGIIRNRLKIEAAINNAQRFLEVQEEFGSFGKYIWQFVGYRTVKNSFRSLSELPARTAESGIMSEGLRKRGFRFVGPTICYAMMQAVGMVNDHLVYCFRHGNI